MGEEKEWAFQPIFYLWRRMHLAELIKQTVEGMGYELVDFESSPRARLLRIFIDRPEGANSGIGVEDCSAVSNQLSRVFTVENVDYDRLEVSSPGLDRPLTRTDDYRRFAGQEVQIKLRLAVGSQRNFSGVLEGLTDSGVADAVPLVRLRVGESLHEFALDNVDRARLVPKF